MRSFLLFSFFLVLFSQYSCKKYAPAPEAFFIKPDLIKVSTTALQGSGNHKITDLWLYVNGQFQGAYPVDNVMPIASNNKLAKIKIFAGIKNNGIASTRIFWPFYEILEFDTLVEAGKTITRPFTFKYKSSVTFTWTENFESSTVGGYTIEKSYRSDATPIIKSGSESLEGKYLELKLSGDSLVAMVQSSGTGFSLPKASSDVYLELNYKCNREFSVGLTGSSINSELKPVIFLKEQADWNKIYIQLATLINTEPVYDLYNVYFRMIRNSNEPEGKLCLDNIKLVHLP